MVQFSIYRINFLKSLFFSSFIYLTKESIIFSLALKLVNSSLYLVEKSILLFLSNFPSVVLVKRAPSFLLLFFIDFFTEKLY